MSSGSAVQLITTPPKISPNKAIRKSSCRSKYIRKKIMSNTNERRVGTRATPQLIPPLCPSPEQQTQPMISTITPLHKVKEWIGKFVRHNPSNI